MAMGVLKPGLVVGDGRRYAGDVTVDGTVVAASFPTDDPRLWNGVVVSRDTLLASS